jgi:hypothetical protein
MPRTAGATGRRRCRRTRRRSGPVGCGRRRPHAAPGCGRRPTAATRASGTGTGRGSPARRGRLVRHALAADAAPGGEVELVGAVVPAVGPDDGVSVGRLALAQPGPVLRTGIGCGGHGEAGRREHGEGTYEKNPSNAHACRRYDGVTAVTTATPVPPVTGQLGKHLASGQAMTIIHVRRLGRVRVPAPRVRRPTSFSAEDQ